MEPNPRLLRKARRSYELARLARGLGAAALVVPMTVVSLGGCGNRETTLAMAAALVVLATALVWRGGPAGRGVVPGLVAGVAPLGFPLVGCPICARFGAHLPMLICVAGGVVSGAIIAAYAARETKDRPWFVVSAGLVAALAGSMGCVILGLGGVAAMAVGLALATPVALVVAPRPAGG